MAPTEEDMMEGMFSYHYDNICILGYPEHRVFSAVISTFNNYAQYSVRQKLSEQFMHRLKRSNS